MDEQSYDLVNDAGRRFTAVYEPDGGRDGDTVAFYDASEDFPYPGQFTGARYYVETIMDHRGGLLLHGGVPIWRLSEFNLLDTQAWLLTISK